MPGCATSDYRTRRIGNTDTFGCTWVSCVYEQNGGQTVVDMYSSNRVLRSTLRNVKDRLRMVTCLTGNFSLSSRRPRKPDVSLDYRRKLIRHTERFLIVSDALRDCGPDRAHPANHRPSLQPQLQLLIVAHPSHPIHTLQHT